MIINADIDPDTVVAHGATLLAKRLSGQANEEEDLVLNDITPLPLGLLQSTQIPQGFLASIFMRAEYEEKMLVFIRKNRTIPCREVKSISLTENDKSLVILEGEGEWARDNVALGEISMNNIKPKDQIDVTFDIDANNILSVTYTVSRLGKTSHKTFLNKQNLDEELLHALIASAE